MAERDYVTEILSAQVSGGSDESTMDISEDMIGNLVAVGALTEVGAAAMKKAARGGQASASPAFMRSSRETERRAPLGMAEDGTGANFFTLAAAVGATTTMRGKVSRVARVDRFLIIPSLPGAVIESIKVGDEEQVLASGVPVELYGVTALTDSIPDNFSPIGPGLDFIVTLKNTTAVAITGTIGSKADCKR
jgi:hypothetical protein